MIEQNLPDLMGDALGGISLGRQPHVSTDNKQFMAVSGREKRNLGQFDQQRGAIFLEFMVVGMARHAMRAHFALKPKDANDPNPGQIAVYDPANPIPPICTSENGVGPSTSSRQPQAPVCANCWAAQWGSAISQRGERIPACTSKKRLVIIPALAEWWETPLQFDVPPAAFQNWAALIQMLRDGKITRLESVVIRAYFIDMAEGFLKFELSPLGYVQNAFGENALPVLHRHMVSEPVALLAGKNDQAIDPSTWSPSMAQAMIPGQYGQQPQLAAPVQTPQPPVQGQPGLTYAPQTQAQIGSAQPQQYANPAQYEAQPGYPNQSAGQYNTPPAAPAPVPTGMVQQPQQYSPPPAAPIHQPAPGPVQTGYNPNAGGYQQGGGFPNGAPQGPGFVQNGPGAPVSMNQPGGPVPGPVPVYQQPAQLPPPPTSFQQPTTPPEQDMHAGAVIDGEPAGGKRKRRTKVEMEAVRVAQAGGQPQQTNAAGQMAGYGMASPGDGNVDALRSQMQNAMGMQIPNS